MVRSSCRRYSPLTQFLNPQRELPPLDKPLLSWGLKQELLLSLDKKDSEASSLRMHLLMWFETQRYLAYYQNEVLGLVINLAKSCSMKFLSATGWAFTNSGILTSSVGSGHVPNSADPNVNNAGHFGLRQLGIQQDWHLNLSDICLDSFGLILDCFKVTRKQGR